jgi:hypothetical protein
MSAATRLAAGNVHRDQERLVRTSVDWALIAGSFSQCEMSPFGPKRHLMRRGDLVAPWVEADIGDLSSTRQLC